jgi:hypothetical protein
MWLAPPLDNPVGSLGRTGGKKAHSNKTDGGGKNQASVAHFRTPR